MNIFQKIIADGRARQRRELVRFLRSYAVHAARPEDREAARQALIKMGFLPGDDDLLIYVRTRWGDSAGELFYDREAIRQLIELTVQEVARGDRAGASLLSWFHADNADWRTYTVDEWPAPKKPLAERLYERIMAFWDRWLPDPDRPRKIIVGHLEVKIDWGDVPQQYRRTRELLHRITSEDAYLGRVPDRTDE